MARPKKIVQKVAEEHTNTVQENINIALIAKVDELCDRVDILQDTLSKVQNRLLDLEIDILDLKKICIKPKGESINKLEKFNGELLPTIESYNGMKMDDSDRIQSMRNAIKILPPNMIVDGRHLKENVEAIVGFKVLDEMMDAAYEGIEQ